MEAGADGANGTFHHDCGFLITHPVEVAYHQKFRDFGVRSLHVTAETAKRLIAVCYSERSRNRVKLA
jgi:hypothetical protein